MCIDTHVQWLDKRNGRTQGALARTTGAPQADISSFLSGRLTYSKMQRVSSLLMRALRPETPERETCPARKRTRKRTRDPTKPAYVPEAGFSPNDRRRSEISKLNALTSRQEEVFNELPAEVRSKLIRLDFDSWDDVKNTLKCDDEMVTTIKKIVQVVMLSAAFRPHPTCALSISLEIDEHITMAT